MGYWKEIKDAGFGGVYFINKKGDILAKITPTNQRGRKSAHWIEIISPTTKKFERVEGLHSLNSAKNIVKQKLKT